MSAISVLQVVTSTDRRGAETFAVDLGNALADRGLTIETVALAPGSSGGLDLPTLGSSTLGPPTLRALRRRARSFDVVIAHGSTTLPACALGLAGAGTPFVYRNIGDPTHWSSDPFRRWRTAAFLSRAIRVIALGTEAAKTLHEHYRIGRDRLVMIPTGVSAERFQPATTAARHGSRARSGISHDATVAAMVGALSEEKGAEEALHAFAASPAIDVLLIAGDGPDRPRLEALAHALAPGRIRFLGSVDPRPVYAASDLVLLASHTEGLPAVLIEAGLCGLPVVATDVGYVREIVVDGVTGIVVPPRDRESMRRALAEALELPDVARAARERCVERFELASVATQWCDALEAICPWLPGS
jgi:glycosyltransferase involved in cell wall biosynthesis